MQLPVPEDGLFSAICAAQSGILDWLQLTILTLQVHLHITLLNGMDERYMKAATIRNILDSYCLSGTQYSGFSRFGPQGLLSFRTLLVPLNPVGKWSVCLYRRGRRYGVHYFLAICCNSDELFRGQNLSPRNYCPLLPHRICFAHNPVSDHQSAKYT
jgi:hypothetical protein